MLLRWQGHPSIRRGGKLREPIIGESFSGIDELADSLLRESVQNSLDAVDDKSQPVRVRFFVSGESGALSPSQAMSWFGDAWPHFLADESLRMIKQDQPCSFVAVEDFNTRGLTGDVDAHRSSKEEPNPWCLFFRKEGQSQKSAEDRGRWGVGKVVFPISSDVRAFIGATVRVDDKKRYVMGQAMLRSREVSGREFDPDLWFCEMDSNHFEMPSADPDLYESLRSSFGLTRSQEPGLSVVIPYANRDITADALITAAIREWFYPILSRKLVLEIASSNAPCVTLDSGNLVEQARAFSDPQWPDTTRHVEMAQWSLTQASTPPSTVCPPNSGALKWNTALLPESMAGPIRSTLDAGEPVAIRVSTRVLHNGGQPSEDTFFDLVLRRSEDSQLHRPVYVRSGLVIPDVKGSQVRGYYAVVIATDAPVCTMLGDAENPAHTDWLKNSGNFKDKYKFAVSQLEFVRQAPINICSLLSQADAPVHRNALVDVFYLSDENELPPGPRPKPKPGGETTPVIKPETTARPRAYAVRAAKDGVVITSTDRSLESGRRLEVRLAYDVSRGDPLKKYRPADFRVQELKKSVEGMVMERAENNLLVFRATQMTFRIEIKGFDINRDLYVKVREREAES